MKRVALGTLLLSLCSLGAQAASVQAVQSCFSQAYTIALDAGDPQYNDAADAAASLCAHVTNDAGIKLVLSCFQTYVRGPGGVGAYYKPYGVLCSSVTQN